MILFFVRADVDSDRFVKHCYAHYRDIMRQYNPNLPPQVRILREEGKKPRLDTDEAYFNLSHSHGLSVLAISHAPIGVDVEMVRPIDFAKFDFISAENEQDFFEQWTQRESYVKFTGEGLGAMRKQPPADAHFEHFDVFDGYHVCVCAEEQNVTAYEMNAEDID